MTANPQPQTDAMGYREQEHNQAPPWFFQKFPAGLVRAVRIQAMIQGQTITEYMVEVLAPVPDLAKNNPDKLAPTLDIENWQALPAWNVKHFPADLREELKTAAFDVAKVPLFELVARELAQAAGWKP